MSADLDDLKIDTLIDQLKDQTALIRSQDPIVPVNKENVEGFILNTSGELIQRGMDMVKNLQDDAIASKDPETIEAVSKLVASVASAIEALNKTVLMDKKVKGSKEIKQMEINAKSSNEEKEQTKDPNKLVLKGTREEIFAKLIKEADVIEINPPDLKASS